MCHHDTFVFMPEFREQLQPNCCYHIYNDANGDEKLFEGEFDYFNFLLRMKKYINPVADLLSYCLQPSEFHIVLQIKSEHQVMKFLKKGLTEEQFQLLYDGDFIVEKKLSKICSNFFNSYAKKFNCVHNRKGNLFKRAFKREIVDTKADLKKIINEVNLLPVRRGLVSTPGSWEYSSFSSLISEKNSLLIPNKVWKIFGSKEIFNELLNYDLARYSN